MTCSALPISFSDTEGIQIRRTLLLRVGMFES